jgi:hypothetical protein
VHGNSGSSAHLSGAARGVCPADQRVDVAIRSRERVRRDAQLHGGGATRSPRCSGRATATHNTINTIARRDARRPSGPLLHPTRSRRFLQV